ncbi:Hypothetical protein A7982_04273 [Minicystis rosea]|nr:Hypothetical protein A7982_04273 [Minicystis rosea]
MKPLNFETVRSLPAPELRRLLAEGDAPERLWAAWAVALRLGADAVPLLARAETLRMPSGLRQQVLVIVAGLGEREVLRVLADQDDSPAVRATACAYFIRTAPYSTDEDTLAFATRHLGSEISAIREAVLEEHLALRLRLPDAALQSALEDADDGIRALAARCLAKEQLSEASLHALIDALAREPEPDRVPELFGMLPPSSYRVLCARLRSARTDRVAKILDLVHERVGSLDWPELMGLEESDDPSVLLRMLRLLQSPLPDEAVAWAARVYTGRLMQGAPEAIEHWDRDQAAWRAHLLLRSSLSPSAVRRMDALTVTLLRQTFEATYAESVRSVEEDDLYDLEAQYGAIVDMQRCLALLAAHQG